MEIRGFVTAIGPASLGILMGWLVIGAISLIGWLAERFRRRRKWWE